jgi:hypothetical protein
MHPGAREQRQGLGKNASLGDGDDDVGVRHGCAGFTIGVGQVQPRVHGR